jgi:hypothetical protein
MNHTPPGNASTEAGHHAADLAGAAAPDALGDIAVGHDPPRRDGVHHIEDRRGVVVDRVSH